MKAAVGAIEYHFPEGLLTNQQLSDEFEAWSAEKIAGKTGIASRRISAADECASDLGVAAVEKLFAGGACRRDEVDYLILCTQSPDYFLPTTACLMQHRLGLPTTCGAIDFNLGCSGYIYGLGLAKGLIETGQAKRVVLVTAETYSKHIHRADKSVRTLFGDAAAATLVEGVESSRDLMGPFVYGTDGAGAENLIVPTGGLRRRTVVDAPEDTDESGNVRTVNHLFMNGAEIFTFTLQSVPQCFARLQEAAGIGPDDVDLYVFHQANEFMLAHLRKKMKLPEEKFYISLADCGNTVSSTIPIALRRAVDEGRLRPGQTAALVGFGVGYSWGATLLRWTDPTRA